MRTPVPVFSEATTLRCQSGNPRTYDDSVETGQSPPVASRRFLLPCLKKILGVWGQRPRYHFIIVNPPPRPTLRWQRGNQPHFLTMSNWELLTMSIWKTTVTLASRLRWLPHY